MTPEITRRFTVEPSRPPAPRQPYQRPASTHLARAAANRTNRDNPGICLFPGDFLHIDRRLRTVNSALKQSLQNSLLVFHVVDVGAGESDPFIKIRFECPQGVYVSTFRCGQEAHPAAAWKFARDDEQSSFYPVKKGDALVIRPSANLEQCIGDLDGHGIQIHGWHDRLHKDMCLKVASSDRWSIEIMASSEVSAASTSPAPRSAPVTERQDTLLFVTSMARAIEEKYGKEAYRELSDRAWEIARGS